MIDISIPVEYKEYKEVNLCSNELQNVKYFFGIGNVPPIIVGKGDDGPICWLYIQNNGVWKEAVTANRSNFLPLQVFAHGNKLLIQLTNEIILDSFEDKNSKLIIEKINLKPMGFNIEGDSKGLNVGGNVISTNKIIGGRFFVGLG